MWESSMKRRDLAGETELMIPCPVREFYHGKILFNRDKVICQGTWRSLSSKSIVISSLFLGTVSFQHVIDFDFVLP